MINNFRNTMTKIESVRRYRNITLYQMAQAMGMSETTYKRKRKNPGLLTLTELNDAINFLKITPQMVCIDRESVVL